MKAFYVLIFGLALLPACGKKKTVVQEDYTYTEERVSGVEHAVPAEYLK